MLIYIHDLTIFRYVKRSLAIKVKRIRNRLGEHEL